MQVLNILVRLHVSIKDLGQTIAFYETLLGQQARLNVIVIPNEFQVVQVANMLLIGATESFLSMVKDIQACYLVEDINAIATNLVKMGATIQVPLTKITTGSYMIIEHPDGMKVEYVEHTNKNPLDTMLKII